MLLVRAIKVLTLFTSVSAGPRFLLFAHERIAVTTKRRRRLFLQKVFLDGRSVLFALRTNARARKSSV